MKRLLFVCTGNTCRSPMAELYFVHRCRERGISGVTAASAGVMAVPGMPISEPARLALEKFDIDAGSFRSRVLSREIVDSSDLVVVMTESHRRGVLALCPEAAPKCRLLSEFSGGFGAIPDPWGGSAAIYAAVLSRMRPALEALVDRFAAAGR